MLQAGSTATGAWKRLRRLLVGLFIAWATVTLVCMSVYLVNGLRASQRAEAAERDLHAAQEALHEALISLPPTWPSEPKQEAFLKASSELQAALSKGAPVTPGEISDVGGLLSALQAAARDLVDELAQPGDPIRTALVATRGSLDALERSLPAAAANRTWQDSLVDVYRLGGKGLVALFVSLMAWPVISVILLALFLKYAEKGGSLSDLFRRIQSVSVTKGEFVFSAVQSDVQSQSTNKVFRQFRETASREIATLASSEDLPKRVENVANRGLKPWLRQEFRARWNPPSIVEHGKKPLTRDERSQATDAEFERRWKSLRFTCHVRDLVLRQTLCQLVDYYQGDKNTAGRVWSVRYGMIGRVWREQQSRSEIDVPKDETKLVIEWGMTRDEVRNFASPRTSFTTVLIKGEDEEPIATFYMDSEIRNVFELPEEDAPRHAAIAALHQTIESACRHHDLDGALRRIARAIKNRSLDIKLEGKLDG